MKTLDIIVEVLCYCSILMGGILVDLDYSFYGVILVGMPAYLIGLKQMKRIKESENKK